MLNENSASNRSQKTKVKGNKIAGCTPTFNVCSDTFKKILTYLISI